VDLRREPWERRRKRLELLARAFGPPLELSPLVPPSRALATAVLGGKVEGIVLKDRASAYRSGSRAGWSKVKSPDWYERRRRRFGQ
jgi:ATP-dependent DNA ligase